MSKLVPKIITDRNGHQKTVYVNPGYVHPSSLNGISLLPSDLDIISGYQPGISFNGLPNSIAFTPKSVTPITVGGNEAIGIKFDEPLDNQEVILVADPGTENNDYAPRIMSIYRAVDGSEDHSLDTYVKGKQADYDCPEIYVNGQRKAIHLIDERDWDVRSGKRHLSLEEDYLQRMGNFIKHDSDYDIQDEGEIEWINDDAMFGRFTEKGIHYIDSTGRTSMAAILERSQEARDWIYEHGPKPKYD